jgi:Ca2+-binding RTX toxin-like protein
MKKHGVLIGALATLAVVGASATPAFAGTVRVDTGTDGVRRVLFTETTLSKDPVTGKAVQKQETNNIKISTFGDQIIIEDTGDSPLTAGVKCRIPDPANLQVASCDSAGIQRLDFLLGAMGDTWNNTTTYNANVTGGGGTDTIVNAGGGDDLLNLRGTDKDVVDSCGAGNDKADFDRRDSFSTANNGCETVFNEGVQILPVLPTPPPGGTPPPVPVTPPSGGGGSTPPPAPNNLPVIQQAPAGTQAPNIAPSLLGATPTGKCLAKFIGTAAADRIEGSNNGDIEYGQAGNDYLRGQANDDCLFGLDGNDTMIGDEGADTLAGGNGDDKGYGGAGNDIVNGNAGKDLLYGDAGNDRVSGGAGVDKMFGGLGVDKLYGGLGNDTIDAGAGNDYVSGGGGSDRIITGSGNDTILGGPNGGDRISAGPGVDKINSRNKRKDTVDCGAGRDSVTADKVDVLRNCERVTRR